MPFSGVRMDTAKPLSELILLIFLPGGRVLEACGALGGGGDTVFSEACLDTAEALIQPWSWSSSFWFSSPAVAC